MRFYRFNYSYPSVSLRLALLVVLIVSLETIVFATETDRELYTSHTIPLISASSLIRITYQNNKEIEAVRYDLQAAEIAFKQFERGLSQFTPFLAESKANRKKDRYPKDEYPRSKTDYGYSSRVGMEKEFFNGSSVSSGIGYRGFEGESSEGGVPFAEMEYKFPLFGSYTTLRRVTDRTFEENEVFNARLDYVDTIRYTIQSSQELYIWLQVILDRLEFSRESHSFYEELLLKSRVLSTPADKNLVEDQIKSIRSDITKYTGDANSYRLMLQDQIGFLELPISRVQRFDFLGEKQYGSDYLERKSEQVFLEAIQNDAEIKVLEMALDNSRLKKELAQKGKWDIFGKFYGNFDLDGNEDNDGYSGYDVGIGVDIRFIDPTYQNLSMKRSQAEINKYTSKIENRRRELNNFIIQKMSESANFKQQVENLSASITSRNKVVEQKLLAYLQERETMDNLLSARRDLYDSQIKRSTTLGDFFEIITELDERTGCYFRQLGISIDEQGK